MTCYNFGVINNYNLFTLGNVSQSNCDIEGRAAIGGNVIFNNMTIGGKIVASYGVDNTFVVGSNLTWNSGTNKSGNTVMKPAGVYSVTSVSHENADPNQPKRPSTFPIDFVQSFTELKCASTQWSSVSSAGSVFISNCYGTIYLIGNSTSLNVFKFDANQIAPQANILGGGPNSLSNISGISIVVPEGSTVLLNISGTSIQFGGYQISRNTSVPTPFPTSVSSFCGSIQPGGVPTADQKSKIMWNFYQATSIQMGSTSIQGSLLAPYATLKTAWTNIEGNVMVNNVDGSAGSTELHYYPFSGCLPLVNCQTTTTTTTPAPTTTTTTTTTKAPTTTTTTSIIEKLSTIKYVSNKNIAPGEILDYTIIVTNKWNVPITNLTLEDTLDLNTEYITGSAQVFINTSTAPFMDTSTPTKVILKLSNSLAPSATAIFNFKVKVKSDVPVDTKIKNSGFITSTETTTQLKTNETTVNIQLANLIITKVANKNSVECGGDLTYTFTIENTGNIDATGVVFKDYFEDELQFDVSKIVAPIGSIISKITEYNGVSITIPKIQGKSSISITIPVAIRCCGN